MHPPRFVGHSQMIADGGGGRHNIWQRDFIFLLFKMQDDDDEFFAEWV